MSDAIPYLKIRAVRDETGASHDECRQALEQTGGDVSAAASLWFAQRRGMAAPPAPVQDPRQMNHSQS
jgi:translation elongation factor EF-Ts